MKNIFYILNSIISNRKLILDLSFKDLKKRFAGSTLGFAWAILKPLLTAIVYLLVFQFAFKSSDVNDVPFSIWFIVGIIPWLFISEVIESASNCFLEYSFLVKKVIFNYDILPLVKILSSLFIHVVFICIALIACGFMNLGINLHFLMILYYLFCAVCFSFSVSLLFSTILVFFRDLSQIINLILLVGMWAAPIAWNLEQFSMQVQIFLMLNPVVYIINGYRIAYFGSSQLFQGLYYTLYFWIAVSILLLVGTSLYKKLKGSFADVL